MDSLKYDSYTDSYWYQDMESGDWVEVTQQELDGEIPTWI